MMPAILCNDKLVTGVHHGDAFSKLSKQEQDGECLSGFIDNLKFICDDKIIYLKEIILMRHGESYTDQDNGPLTEIGRSQTQKAAAFLLKMNLKGYVGLSSPYNRCQQTSKILSESCSITFTTNECLSRKTPVECNQDFQKRMNYLLDTLPEKSILITHTDFIQNILALTNLISEQKPIENCSITYIFRNRLIWLAKNVME